MDSEGDAEGKPGSRDGRTGAGVTLGGTTDAAPGAGSGEVADADLLRAHVAGDGAAFATLIRRHQSRLWIAAHMVLRDHDEAKDAVQEGLIRAFRSAETWRGQGSVAGWLYRIVSRTALDRATALARHRHEALDEIAPRLVAARDNVEDAAAEDVVRAVVAALPPDQRECFVRIDLLGFSFAEVAADLGLANGTVRSRRARGKARVVEALRQAGHAGRSAPRHPRGDAPRPRDAPGEYPRAAGPGAAS